MFKIVGGIVLAAVILSWLGYHGAEITKEKAQAGAVTTATASVDPAQATIEALLTQVAVLEDGKSAPTAKAEGSGGVPAEPTATASNASRTKVCKAKDGEGFYLDGLTSLDSTDMYLHVQFWTPDGSGLEYETILEPGANWTVDTQGGGGKVWEYPAEGCSYDQVRQQATLSINRRGSQSGGFVAWDKSSGVFAKN